MEKHIKILGIIYIVHSIFFMIVAAVLFIAVAGIGIISCDQDTMAVGAIIAIVASLFFMLTSLPGLIGGIGLLKYQPWAKWLVLILGFLNLFNVPFGTILGAYTI